MMWVCLYLFYYYILCGPLRSLLHNEDQIKLFFKLVLARARQYRKNLNYNFYGHSDLFTFLISLIFFL